MVTAVAVRDVEDYVNTNEPTFTLIFGFIMISIPQLSVTVRSLLATLVTSAYGACILNIKDWSVLDTILKPYVGVRVPDKAADEITGFVSEAKPFQSFELQVLIANVFFGIEVAINGVDKYPFVMSESLFSLYAI